MNLPFSIWLVRSFFSTIPTDLEEAARIDGCSQFKTFYKIILPLALPGLATVAIFTFVNSWNDYLMASLFLRSDDIYTLTVGLHSFINQHSFQWSNLMSASTVSVLPTVLFLVIAQKYLIQGLSAGCYQGISDIKFVRDFRPVYQRLSPQHSLFTTLGLFLITWLVIEGPARLIKNFFRGKK